VEEGNIIMLLNNVLSQLNHKFLIRPIEFEGMYRIEKGEYPVPALREMLLNALVHRNYMGSFTQIRVYDDKILIWNDGGLPEGISVESLKRTHFSKPRNLLIADVCFKGGLIDSWGRGTLRIIDTCKEAGLPDPELVERDGGFLVTLFKNNLTEEQLRKLGLNERQVDAILFYRSKGEITSSEYAEKYSVSDRTARTDLSELVDKDLLLKQGDYKTTKFYFR
jgi:ATP-dependent DNA helicase RecG